MSTGPRPSGRSRRLLVLPLIVCLVAGGAKLIAMYAFAAAGEDAYDAGRYESSESSFSRLDTFNVVHPWRAHVGIGDARYRRGDLLGAEAAFAHALDLAPGRCEIRFNLAVTIEAQGDRAYAADGGSRVADAAQRYADALDVVEAGTCPSRHSDDVGDRLIATKARLVVKLASLSDAAAQDEATDPAQQSESDRGDSEQINDLERRNESGAAQREEARDRDTTGVLPEGQSNW
jgi:hypothetical protein